MISRTAAEFLAEKLSDLDATTLGDLAAFAGVELKIARRACKGEDISASDALALFGALGIDPVTREAITPQRVGKLKLDTLALFLVGQMARQKHGTRNAASMMGVTQRVVYAIRDGKPVSLANVLRACAYMGAHPFEHCERIKERAAA